MSIIEEQELAARRALPPIPDRLGEGATGEQIQQRQKLMAERARQLNKISKKSATAKRALEGDARPAEVVAVKRALNANRPKGDDRPAEVVAARATANADSNPARPTGADRSAAQLRRAT